MKKEKFKPGLRAKIHYRFDELMSSGTIALIGALGVFSFSVILISSLIIHIFRFTQTLNSQPLTIPEAMWESLMRSLDSGTMGQDTGWGFRYVMLIVTICGIFVVSTLIGIIATGIQQKIHDLRRGKSSILETNHTLILGWTNKIFSIVSELIIANENKKKPAIVILADMDKIEMEDLLKEKIKDFKNSKVICRSGNPMDMESLMMMNPEFTKSIIILNPETGDLDINIIKTILAIKKYTKEHNNIIAEMNDETNLKVAKMIGENKVTLILTNDIISRIIAQTCRQSGLSAVYTELFDFSGSEIYFKEEPSLTGFSFKESLFKYNDSCVIGIRKENGAILVNPPMDIKIEKGDKIIAISENDESIILNGKNYKISDDILAIKKEKQLQTENTLIIGWNNLAHLIIRELDNYVPQNSKITIAVNEFVKESEICKEKIEKNLSKSNLEIFYGNTSDRETLESLDAGRYDHIIILSYSNFLEPDKADAKTLLTLLHLRDIADKTNSKFNIVSELLNVRDKQLAEITNVHDFIVSDHLVSLILTQLSENKELIEVFYDILNAEGSEIYLKPIEEYIKINTETDFYQVIENASRKNEVAIGYRKSSQVFEAEKSFGVVVNPVKNKKIFFEKGDKVIVFAED